MKRSLLLLAALGMMSSASFAQQKVDVSKLACNAKAIEFNSPKMALTTSAQPRRAKGGAAGSVYYHRPVGSYYLGVDNQFRGFAKTYLAIPAFSDVMFVNASKNPAQTKWMIGGKEVNESMLRGNDLVFRVKSSLLTGDGQLSNYGMPSLTDGKDTFILSQENKDQPEGGVIAPDSLYSFTIADPKSGMYYGGQGPSPFFGDIPMKVQGKDYKQVSFYQVYPASLGGLYINEIHIPAWNATKGITSLLADGDQLTATIRNVVDGQPGEEVLGTFIATKADLMFDDEHSLLGRQGIISFRNKIDDGFGGFLDGYTVIEKGKEFAVVISGFENKKLGFYFMQAPDYALVSGDGQNSPFVFDSTLPASTQMVIAGADNSTRTVSYLYALWAAITFQGYQDQVLFNDSYTLEGSTGSFSHLELDIPVAGGEAKTAHGDYAYLFSALPFADADGNANYNVTIDFDGGEEWLTEDDIRTDGSKFKDSGLTLFSVNAPALPAGKTGRHAFVTVEGKGVKTTKLVVRQGNDNTTGVTGIAADSKQTGVRFNTIGQRVSKDFKGIVVENGKKFLVK